MYAPASKGLAITPPAQALELVGPQKRPFQISRLAGPVVVFALFIGLWYFMHYKGLRLLFDKPGERLIPLPTDVWRATVVSEGTRGDYVSGIGWTAVAAYGGLAITIVLGLLLAVVMLQARWAEGAIYPYLVALQAIPVLAIVPIIYVIFGGSMSARLFVCIMISFFPIVTNALFGMKSVDRSQHDLFTLRRASRWTRLVKLQLPSALPAIFTGFRISAGLSIIGAVVGEQFFRGGSKPGVGIVIEKWRTKGVYPPLWGGIIIACLMGIGTFLVFGIVQRLAVGHWYDGETQKD
ncbi:MAG: ABC transporter permease subunit [Ilumatobacteraceae bacterium]